MQSKRILRKEDKESVSRICLLRKQIEKTKLQGFLVHNNKNIYYLTQFMSTGGAYLLVLEESGPVLWVSKLEWNRAKEEAENCELRMFKQRIKTTGLIAKELLDSKLKRISFDDIAVKEYLELVRKWGGEMRNETQLIWNLRKVKDNEEIAIMREAAKLADLGVQVALETAVPGVDEFKVAAEAEYAMRIKQSQGTAFETIVASGPRSAFPHGPPTKRKIQRGDLVVVDIGAVFRNYRSDITRTIVAGKPSEKQSEIFNTVVEAQETALKRYKDNSRCSLVDQAARSLIENRGYGEYFIHGLGHGIGLDIHEPPTISPSSEDLLESGCSVSNEPGIYIPGTGGIRVEDMILVGQNSGERITSAPRRIQV
jgi:Xaa-Pro aminopeptidase